MMTLEEAKQALARAKASGDQAAIASAQAAVTAAQQQAQPPKPSPSPQPPKRAIALPPPPGGPQGGPNQNPQPAPQPRTMAPVQPPGPPAPKVTRTSPPAAPPVVAPSQGVNRAPPPPASRGMEMTTPGITEAPMDVETARQKFLQDILNAGNNVDTSKEEALIREQMQAQLGESLVNRRASMGRSGFGASGALNAMEGDIENQARRNAVERILATQRGARQEATDNAFRGVSGAGDLRSEARDDAQFEEQKKINEALIAMFGEDAAPVDEGDPGPEPTPGQTNTTDSWRSYTGKTYNEGGNGRVEAVDGKWIDPNDPPRGYRFINGQWMYNRAWA